MRQLSISPRSKFTGFSLIDIMVGLLIGSIGIIIMLQVFSQSEKNKRTTTSGDDAQSNGAVTLFGLQREIRQSGYGTSAVNILGCDLQLRSGVVLTNLAPVSINHDAIPPGDDNTDTLLVVYGNTNGAPEGDAIVLQPATNTYTVAAPSSFLVGDSVVAAAHIRPATCNLVMTTVQSIASSNVTVQTGVSGMVNGTLYRFGQAPTVAAYAVRNNKLTRCDYMLNDCSDSSQISDTSIWIPIADNISSLRAEYGKDTTPAAMDAIVDGYNAITPGSTADTSGFAVNCGWVRISAIRLALVARDGQYDKDVVTSASPSWAGMSSIDLSSSSTDWQHYRYKLFQTVAPLRNIISQGVISGC